MFFCLLGYEVFLLIFSWLGCYIPDGIPFIFFFGVNSIFLRT
jgi:hypothetical protein